jgi:hypothetical protein
MYTINTKAKYILNTEIMKINVVLSPAGIINITALKSKLGEA